jgi:HEAT repeat protein
MEEPYVTNTIIRTIPGTIALILVLLLFPAVSGTDAATDIDRIKAGLNDADWEKRIAAVDELGKKRDEQSLRMLMEIADTSVEYWPIKIRAITILGEMGDPRSLEILLKVYYDPFLHAECPSIKSYTATALGYFNKDSRVVDALISGINDGETLTREAVVRSLGRIGNRKAVPALVSALNDKSVAVRLSAVNSIEQIGDPQAKPPLQTAASKDSDPLMRERARSALMTFR